MSGKGKEGRKGGSDWEMIKEVIPSVILSDQDSNGRGGDTSQVLTSSGRVRSGTKGRKFRLGNDKGGQWVP